MKKDTIVYLVLFANLAISICLKIFTRYEYFAGCYSGAVAMLLIFSSIGKWQANKAAKQIDEMIRQKRNF